MRVRILLIVVLGLLPLLLAACGKHGGY